MSYFKHVFDAIIKILIFGPQYNFVVLESKHWVQIKKNSKYPSTGIYVHISVTHEKKTISLYTCQSCQSSYTGYHQKHVHISGKFHTGVGIFSYW